MAHFINCSSCGKQYNDQAFDKCPHCGFNPNPTTSTVFCPNRLCGKEISIKFEKCPFCGTPLQGHPISPKTGDESDFEWEGGLLALPRKIGNFSQKMPLKKALIVLFGELILGLLFMLLGYIITSGIGSGDNDVSAFMYLLGMFLICHSTYCIIKRVVNEYINKKKSDWTERKKKIVVYLSEIIFSIIISLPGIFSLDDTDGEWKIMLFLLGIGIFIISAYSLYKYLTKPYREKKEKERIEKIKKKYNLKY